MKQYWYDHHSNLILDTEWPIEKQVQSLADFVTKLDREILQKLDILIEIRKDEKKEEQ